MAITFNVGEWFSLPEQKRVHLAERKKKGEGTYLESRIPAEVRPVENAAQCRAQDARQDGQLTDPPRVGDFFLA
jgi:hypothetical protein